MRAKLINYLVFACGQLKLDVEVILFVLLLIIILHTSFNERVCASSFLKTCSSKCNFFESTIEQRTAVPDAAENYQQKVIKQQCFLQHYFGHLVLFRLTVASEKFILNKTEKLTENS